MKQYKWMSGMILICMAVWLGGCGNLGKNEKEVANITTMAPVAVPVETLAPTPEPTATPLPTPTPFPEYDINLMMVGDNLMHMGIVNTGKQEDGSYNYDFLFEGIFDFLNAAEIKMINQETILGGNEFGFSGYPYFNSPTEVGDAIARAGFNVVLHSSNHTADKRLQGILNCAAFWEQYQEVLAVGIYGEIRELAETETVTENGMNASVTTEVAEIMGNKDALTSVEAVEVLGDVEIETVRIPVLKVKDVTFAILNYAYAPNMESFPREYEGHMDMLCDYDEDTRRIDLTVLHEDVLTDIAAAQTIADFVIVCPHWGTEYTTTPSKYQEKFAAQMTEAGADIILGTHPHVVQPVEWVESENGNRSLCYYSLGNYVSTQKKALCMLEAMAWITIHVDEDGAYIVQEDTGVVPMVCHYNAMPVRMESVYLLEDYTEEQAASHGIKTYGGVVLKLSDLQEWTAEVFEDWILTADQILK